MLAGAAFEKHQTEFADEVPEFDHFGPARWLLENPQILDGDSQAIAATLDRAEKVFRAFNALLP